MSSKTLALAFIVANAFLLVLSLPSNDPKDLLELMKTGGTKEVVELDSGTLKQSLHNKEHILTEKDADELRELMSKGGKTETTEIDIGKAKQIIEGTSSRRRRAADDEDLGSFVDFFTKLSSQSGSDSVRYGLEKNVKPMKCVVKKFNNVKFLGQLTGVAENIDSEDICGGICYQFNFEGGQCKSANYLKNSRKCELMADVFDAAGPMSKFITYYVEISRNSLYVVPVSCKEEGGPVITPPTVKTTGSFNGNISLKNSCGKTLFPNRVSKASPASPSTRIVGGTEARPHSMPWIISIQENGSPFCGGSLIRCSEQDSSRLILTAAHCIQQPGRWSELKPEDLTVGLGEHSLTNKDQGEQRIRVSGFEVNKDYNEETSANDIAVVQLSQPVQFSQTIQPACLPDATDKLPEPGTKCIVAGWGTTSEGGRQSDKLMQVISPIISDAVCTSPEYYGSEVQTDKMFCAGYKEGQKDSCQGDSGGPYVCYDGDTATQFGVVSFGIGCARAAKPGVYARVTNYRGWIDQMRSKYCT